MSNRIASYAMEPTSVMQVCNPSGVHTCTCDGVTPIDLADQRLAGCSNAERAVDPGVNVPGGTLIDARNGGSLTD
jgi:hypothetical protein